MHLFFVGDTTDKIQTTLTITYAAVLTVTLLIDSLLNLNFILSIGFIFLSTVLIYFFVGRRLARVKRTLKSQERFVSNVAHELKNSMTYMQLDSELALQSTDNYELGLSKLKSQELIDALKTDLEGLQNMTGIIKNLSTITAYEYKPGQLGLAQVDLNSVLERISGVMSEQSAQGKDMKIYTKIDTESPAYIRGNTSALEQMIANLLNNAVKYSPPGTNITASVQQSAKQVILSIKDNGIGMSKHDIDRIFDPFYRSGDRLAREQEGSGLGLAIVTAVAKEHGAKISVISELKQGTEIRINFPLTVKVRGYAK